MTLSETTDISEIKKTVNSAADAALSVIHFNGATYMAERAFNNIMSTTNVSGIRIIWRLDIFTIIYQLDGKTEILARPVVSVGTNLINLSKVMELSENVRDGKISASDVDSVLQKIIDTPLIHKEWIYVLMDGCAAAFYLKFHHGSFINILIVLAAAMIGEIVRYKLQSKVVQVSRITFICGIISAGIASCLLKLGNIPIDIVTLIASVIYLVPGLRIINGFIDVSDQKFIYIGTQRILNAMFLFLILAIVIMIANTIINI